MNFSNGVRGRRIMLGVSKHYKKSRSHREKLIKNVIGGDGNVIDTFEVDKGHKDGVELHSITDTGLIIIHNKETGKLVTKLIARPAQVMRYYKNSEKSPPMWLMDLLVWHTDLHYNE